MKSLNVFFIILGTSMLIACSPVKIPITNQYQLAQYSDKRFVRNPRPIALWVTAPEAVAGYQTNQMLYINKPFEIEPFAKNSWTNPPADMLYPLMVKSLQSTGYFHAVMSSIYSQGADYRLDTQVLSLEQNFLKRPSILEFSVKVVLTRIPDNKVIASKIINQSVLCSTDTPYGGVVAANKAARQFTAIMSNFVVSHVRG
ncbi:MAG: ABC-type transport auxiliary lipoprotein family protein [Legionella sp.]|uniref:ABC-type transport auxiliary lipoprotein family protein n=1 Tax=Legionella sp. TaxID=459 RepID=UPI0039E5FF52